MIFWDIMAWVVPSIILLIIIAVIGYRRI